MNTLESDIDFSFPTFVISGAMKFEPAVFRPREVVNHVLQTASSFMKNELSFEGYIGDDVPSEVLTIIHLLFPAFCLHS